MRYLLALLLVGCVAPDGKKNSSQNSANSATNNVNSSSNNTASNSSATNSVSSNNTSSNNKPPNVFTSNNASSNNASSNNAGGCETRIDCHDNQECVDGFCTDHLVCETSNYEGGDGSCYATWYGCDGSEYQFECFAEGNWFCTCTENGTSGELITFGDDPCPQAGIQYAANFACGWLVPAIP